MIILIAFVNRIQSVFFTVEPKLIVYKPDTRIKHDIN